MVIKARATATKFFPPLPGEHTPIVEVSCVDEGRWDFLIVFEDGQQDLAAMETYEYVRVSVNYFPC